MEIIQTLISLVFTIFKWTWPLLVLGLGYMIWQNTRRTRWVEAKVDPVILLIQVPRANTKKELAAEQMFAAIHGILQPAGKRRGEGTLQEHLSFEIISIDQHIRFYVWTPRHLRDFVEGQIYAQYPDVEIEEVTDYTALEEGMHIEGTELELTKNEVFPIKTFQNFEVDPLAGITATLSKLEESGEQVWVQVLTRPVEDTWQQKGLSYVEQVKSGRSPLFSGNLVLDLLDWSIDTISLLIRRAFVSPEKESAPTKPEISSSQSTINSAVEEKVTKLGYEVKIRIAYLARSDALATQRLQAVVGAFKQFNTTNLNGFTSSARIQDEKFIQTYRARYFPEGGYILNIEELASLYHLPHETVETPNIVWATYRKSEPPANLPIEGSVPEEELTAFAKTNFRGRGQRFGLKCDDRRRHIYVIGKTGMGKSYMLRGMAISDIFRGEGVAFVDPHGDEIDRIMDFIPEERLDDVILFDPSDTDHPIAFNPMEVPTPEWRSLIASQLVGVLKKIWADSWGPRMEYILRLTLLALLETKDPTMLGITRMLTDKGFRRTVIEQVEDPVVKHFWVNEFASYTERFANEAVAPILNKVGQFLSSPIIRNIVGQEKSSFDLRAAMDEGKIILVNLATGKIGEDNAALMGAMMITKIQLAAMSRANIPEEQRRDFYLYVDEFQNFATDSFAVILSEARKYRLSLIMANQYILQMPETVKNAVFGNVGTMIAFRVGATDASVMEKEFAPAFEASDLVNLPSANIYIKLSIDGITSIPFSAETLTLSEQTEGNEAEVRRRSREKFGRDRAVVEEAINKWTGLDKGMIEDRIRVQDRAEEQRIAAVAENRSRERDERRRGRPAMRPVRQSPSESGNSREGRGDRPGGERRDDRGQGPASAGARPESRERPTERPQRANPDELAAAIKQATQSPPPPKTEAPSGSPEENPAPRTPNPDLAPSPPRRPEQSRPEPATVSGGIEKIEKGNGQELRPGQTVKFD